MLPDETELTPDNPFASTLVTRDVDGFRVALATAANRDPVTDVTVSQAHLTVNNETVLRKILRVQGRACDAVVDFGPKLGEGRLRLHWVIEADGAGGARAHGKGSWNGVRLAEFEVALAQKGRPAGPTALSLSGGVPLDRPEADDDVQRALAGFAKVMETTTEPVNASACIAHCSGPQAGCAATCAIGTSEGALGITPNHVLACLTAEAQCLAEHAAEVEANQAGLRHYG